MNFQVVVMEMKHFSHDHPLKPLEKTSEDYDNMTFGCCDGSYSSVDDNQVVYGCEECNYFIHQSCSEIPHEIQHFYHPDHPLKLCVLQQTENEVECVACHKTYNNCFTYRCAECPDFIMDIQCALLPIKLANSSNSFIHYRHHGHPLTLHQRTDEDGTYHCHVCGTPCLVGSLYRCAQCYIGYHESCIQIDIPQEIQHYFHPHPLRLTNQSKLWSECLACDEYPVSPFLFECPACECFMHIECALLPDKLKQDGCLDHIQDLSHGHPLSLCDSDEKVCKLCKEPCGYPTYGCERCRYFIHESCTGLPLHINHPLHPPHLLTLTVFPKSCYSRPHCKGCDKSLSSYFLAYKCGECKFSLDVDCGGLNPIITFEEHQHILIVSKCEPHVHGDCSVCGTVITEDSFFFSCKSCAYYKLHLLCGPLPCIIEHKCHVDPLKLMNAFVEDYNETDEVYCDACEELRDPKEPVYYCKECNFITEIKCVMSEVLHCLEGHNGNVKLRTANKTRISHNGRVFRARCANIIEEDDTEIDREVEIKCIREKYVEVKLDEYYSGLYFFDSESDQIRKIFQEAGALYSLSDTILERSISKTMGNTDFLWSKLISSVEKQGLRLSSSCAIAEALNESDITSLELLYSNETFKNLMKKLDSFYGGPNFLSMLDRKADIVGIGELMIQQELAPFVKGLLHARGDFTTNATLEPRLKMFFLSLLCNVVRSMYTTNVRDVEERTFQRWWNSIHIVKHVGFEVEFVIDRLSSIALALFGRQVRATFAKTNSQIEKSFDEVKELEAKLDAKRRELEALKLEQALIKKAMEYERSPEMKVCLEHESELKWKKAWEGSLVLFSQDGSQRS